MKHETTAPPEDTGMAAEADRHRPVERAAAGRNGRRDPRHRVAVQAFVAVPSLNSTAYQVQEISRGGMFLGFKEPTSARLEFEQNNVEPGTHVEIAFSFSLSDVRYRFSVNARILRITPQGIGVQFTTHNPPQLAALRELFEQDGESAAPSSPQHPPASEPTRRQALAPPPDTGKWQDWELLE